MVYSTLAGELYDKVIVPRNEGATTKTTLTGQRGCSFIHSLVLLSTCFIINIVGWGGLMLPVMILLMLSL